MDFIVKILYLWLTLFLQCGAPMQHRLSKRLVGSDEVHSLNEFPYVASLQLNYMGSHFCGGVIISEYWVLSTAACLRYADSSPVEPHSLQVKVSGLGRNVGTFHDVDKIIVHPNFKQTTEHLANDIAALHMKKSLFYHNPKVKAIALGRIPDKSGIWVKTAGWGYSQGRGPTGRHFINYYPRLRKLSLQTMDSGHCRKIHNKVRNVVDNEICASGGLGKASCTGDPGNPLITMDKNRLVGIFSGYQTCKGDFPDLYTRVSDYIGWLRRVTGLKLPLD